jgi:hypothetical protein
MFALVSPNQHTDIDCYPPYATLFLHEDILARTLAFEVELQKWRCAEMEAGRGDLGRPLYEDVFEVSCHCIFHSVDDDLHRFLGAWCHRAPLALRNWCTMLCKGYRDL